MPPNQSKLLASRLLLLVAGKRNEGRNRAKRLVRRSTRALLLFSLFLPVYDQTTNEQRATTVSVCDGEEMQAGGERGEEEVIESQQVSRWWRSVYESRLRVFRLKHEIRRGDGKGMCSALVRRSTVANVPGGFGAATINCSEPIVSAMANLIMRTRRCVVGLAAKVDVWCPHDE